MTKQRALRRASALMMVGGALGCGDSTSVKLPRIHDVSVQFVASYNPDFSRNPVVCKRAEISRSEVGTLTSPVLDSGGVLPSGPVDFIVTRTNTALADVSQQGKVSLLGDSVRMWWGVRNGNPEEGHTNFYGRRLPSGVIEGTAKVLKSGGLCPDYLIGTFKAMPR